ncbi:MAG: hypothetical protein V3T49_05020, partial [Dehalococcoidia bacterium]
MTNARMFLLTILTLSLAGLVGCGGSELTRPDPTAVVVVGESAAEPIASVKPTPSVVPILTAQEKEAVDIMWRMLDRYGKANEGAIAEAGRNGHPGLIPVLVEAASRTFEPDVALEISRALEKITGESVGGD